MPLRQTSIQFGRPGPLSWSIVPRGIASRLYIATTLAFATLTVLAASSITYVKSTTEVIGKLEEKAASAIVTRDILVLLERHRRVVEGTPVQIDAASLRYSSYHADSIVVDILRSLSAEPIPEVSDGLDGLVAKAHTVLDLATNLQRSEALRAAGEYSAMAAALQEAAITHRKISLEAATAEAAALVKSGRDVARRHNLAILIALAVIIPTILLIARDLVRRINEITEAMQRVALNEPQLVLPSIRDSDEIGQMARTLEIFKRNAVTLMINSKEIDRLNTWLNIALNNMSRGLSMFDAEQRLLVCNDRYLELYGLTRDEVCAGTTFREIAEKWARKIKHKGYDVPEPVSAWLDRITKRLVSSEPFTETYILPGGQTIEVQVEPLENGGWVDLHEDVTAQRKAEEHIEKLARYDALTGLANRVHFFEALDQSLLPTAAAASFALLLVDLDKFKGVNDSLGHPAGDALLEAVAQRLTASVRDTDVVARLGGDEFAILQRDPAITEREASALARRLLKLLMEPFEVLGHRVTIGGSIGIALAPAHGTKAEDLVKHADLALYRAKLTGRGTYVFFNSDLEHSLSLRQELEADLREALGRGELILYYQPILDLAKGCVTGCEALMRWRHPKRGMVPPNIFIPMAEDLGIIVPMGEWALKQACQDAVTWPESMKVAVNLSASQFGGSDLVQATLDALDASGLKPSRLELEVTESVIIQDSASTLATLNALRRAGVQIALDDFGTGYASLSYLKSYPFNKLKIDQSFVRDLPIRNDCSAIVRAVVGLAAALGMRTVAEGVESAAHLTLVEDAGCDEVQGYYFSRPVPAAEIHALIDGCGDRLREATSGAKPPAKKTSGAGREAPPLAVAGTRLG